MGDNAVRIGVAITGSEKAVRDLTALKQAIEAAVPGMNGGGSSVSTPSNAPPSAPRLTNPVSPTQAGFGGFGSGAGYVPGGFVPAGGVLNPSGGYNTGHSGPIPPGYYAMPQNIGGNGGGTPPPYGGQGGGNGGGFSPNQIVNVHIASSSVPLGGGQNGGSGGGGGGNAGGGGSPLANGVPGGGGAGGSLQSFLSEIARNPTRAGFASALQGVGGAQGLMAEALPLGIVAGAGVASQAALGTWYAHQRAAYQLDTDLAAMTIRGGSVSPAQRAQMESIANEQGYLDARHSLLSGPVGNVLTLGGTLRPLWDRFYIQPEERRIARMQAVSDAQPEIDQLSFMAGAPVGAMRGMNLGISTAARGQAAMFGMGGVRGLVNADFAGVKSGWNGSHTTRVTDDMLQAGLGTIYGYGSRLGQDNMFSALSGGGNPLDQAYNAANVAVSSGDLGALASLQPFLGRDYQRMYDAAVGSRGNMVAQQVNSSRQSALGSQTSLIQATGGGYRAVAGSIGAQAGNLNTQRQTLQYQLRLATSDNDRAAIQAQIAAVDAQQAGLYNSSDTTVFQGRGVENGAFGQYSQNAMTRALYGGGGPGGVDSAYGVESESAMRDFRLYSDMANASRVYSPEQRKQFSQTAEQARLRAQIQVPRERSQFDYSITQGRIGVGGANADAVVTQAALYGGPGDIYSASLSQSRVIGAQRAAVESRLDDPSAHLSQQERLDLIRQGIELRKQESQVIEQSKRSFLDMNVAVASTTRGIAASAAGNAMSFEGAGGGWARSMLGDVAGKSGGTLDAAQRKLDYYDGLVRQGRMSKDSPAYQDAQMGVQSALGQHLSDTMALVTSPVGAAQRGRQLDLQNDMNIASKTYTGFGNMRGMYQEGMDLAGQNLQTAQSGYQAALKQIDADWKRGGVYRTQQEYQGARDEAAAAFKQERNQYTGQIADYAQSLQSGFLDRVISQTYNAPSRMNFVASSFTQAEASRFLGGSSPVFGSRSAADRDAWMMQGPRLMNKWGAGDTTTPQGFVNTAMAGGGVPMGGVLHPGAGVSSAPIQIIVITKDASGKTIGQQNTTATIHALQNGGLVLGAGSQHSAGVSRQ